MCLLRFCFILLSAGWLISGWGADDAVPPGLINEVLFAYKDLPGVNKPQYLSPTVMVVSPDTQTLYVAEYSAKRIDWVNLVSGAIVRSVTVSREPSGLALSSDGLSLWVTCFSPLRPSGVVMEINTASGAILRTLPAGHSPRAPVLGLDGSKLYICNQFKGFVSVMDVVSGRILDSIRTVREPYAAALTPNGAQLLVTNFLPNDRTDVVIHLPLTHKVSAALSIIELASRQVTQIPFIDGSHSLASVCISPDGKYAYVPHIRSAWKVTPLNRIEIGWINANAVSIVDIPNKKYVSVMLLDNVGAGAANPSGIACNSDYLCVGHAGSHEVSIIRRQAMHTALSSFSLPLDTLNSNLTFSIPFTTRKTLGIKGPSNVVMAGNKVYAAGYYSDTLQAVDCITGRIVRTLPLKLSSPMTSVRRGDFLYHDASICQQKWQSCVSCHPDGRQDALNWDMEGKGNPKNDKSHVLSAVTPPAMIAGKRPDMEFAVYEGIQNILFTQPKPADTADIIAFMQTLRPVTSPYLVKGRLSEAALRGRTVFFKAKCNECHRAPFYTDRAFHDVGTKRQTDETGDWDTPTLIEVWRTAPYIHDGQYVNLKEVFTKENHYYLSSFGLTDAQIDDLTEFVNSL